MKYVFIFSIILLAATVLKAHPSASIASLEIWMRLHVNENLILKSSL